VLAIFDDLDTVLLMIPLKMMLIGFETGNAWVAIYALLVWGVTYAFDYATDLHLEVLVPAFALGCVIKSDHLHGSAEYSDRGHVMGAHESPVQAILDWAIKGGFMLLAGAALPPIQLGEMSIVAVLAHVILITIVSNIGKCVPMMAYRDQATLRERLALSIGMFPRGEVGIGVLLVSLEIFRQQNMLDSPAVQQSMTVGALSLAVNLALTGVFIMVVIGLVRKRTAVTLSNHSATKVS
jgi:hypothetical protein